MTRLAQRIPPFTGCGTGRPFLVVLALVLMLTGSGCGRDTGRSGQAAGKTGDRTVAGGTAVVAIPADPGVLNPLIYNSALASTIYAEMHDGLVEMDEDLTWQPRIARSWELAPDGLTLTYHLRPWVWSDGRPLTSRDVVESFALYKDPRVASPWRGQYREVVSATAPDSATVRYEFGRPVADPVRLSFHNILPYHVVKDYDPADVTRWPLNDHPLSCGEFVLKSRVHDSELVLVPNPRYPGAPALLDRVVLRVIPEPSARVLALEAGEVDLVDQISPEDAHRLEASGRVRIAACNGRRFYYLQWNLRNPRFRDAATRRALSLAVDRPGMVKVLLGGYGTPAASPIPPAVWNHDADLAPDPYAPERARELLARAGWRDEDGDGVLERNGLPLEFEILGRQGDPVRENGGVMLKQAFAAVGAKAELRSLELASGLARLQTGDFDVYFGLLRANLYGDPSGYVHSLAVDQFNKGHYANATVDSLLDAALGDPDRGRTLPMWYRLQEELAIDPPCAYLFYPDYLVGVSKRIRDARPHLLSPLNNLSQWWIAPNDRKYLSRD